MKKMIYVCSECKRACCWYGEFMCDESRNASIVLADVNELEELNIESPDYWNDETLIKIYGEIPEHTWREI